MRVYERTRQLFAARGRDWERPETQEANDETEEPLLVDCAQASLRGVGLLGDDAGQRLVPATAPALRVSGDLRDRYATGGFDLNASRRVRADDVTGRERLCRYILHPPLAHDRLSFTDDGRVRVRFSRPWRNGVDAITLSPLTFIGRLVPLVPRPGTHRLVYFGVLAAHSALRASVVPERPQPPAQLLLFPTTTSTTETTGTTTATPPTPRLPRICWSRLLKRMAGFDMETCPDCGAALRITGLVLEPHQIQRELEARDLVPPLTRSPSRGPPSPQLALFPMAA